MAVFKKGNF
uniref:Uncharacterized protein n=1 Tax=Arundo donax TaxID=35708 RepID=A0A0A9AWD3_ARUDO